MIRWYFVRIWPTMKSMGYKWVMRLDNDSYILSPISYNIFGFMEYFGVDYATGISHENQDGMGITFITSHETLSNNKMVASMVGYWIHVGHKI